MEAGDQLPVQSLCKYKDLHIGRSVVSIDYLIKIVEFLLYEIGRQ